MTDTALDVSSGASYPEFEASLDSIDTEATTPEAVETPETVEAAPAVESPEAAPEAEQAVEETAEEPEPVEAKAEEPPAEETPEIEPDVKERLNAKGKKEFVLPEGRYQNLQTRAQAARMFEEKAGEPLSEALVDDLVDARYRHDQMISDFVAGNDAFLDGLAALSESARQEDGIQHDPIASLADKMVDYLAVKKPEVYQQQSQKYLRDVLDDVYQQAKQGGDKNLLAAAQVLDLAVFKRYSREAEIRVPDPIEEREAKIASREQEFQQRVQREETERWKAWTQQTNSSIQSARAEEIKSALAPIEKAYEKHPETFQGFKAQLNELVAQKIQEDSRWRSMQKNLIREAQMTRSEQRRKLLADQIISRERAKIKTILEPQYNDALRKILTAGAQAVKTRADAQRARSENGQFRKEPGSGGAPVKRSIVPSIPNGLVGAERVAWEIDQLIPD